MFHQWSHRRRDLCQVLKIKTSRHVLRHWGLPGAVRAALMEKKVAHVPSKGSEKVSQGVGYFESKTWSLYLLPQENRLTWAR